MDVDQHNSSHPSGPQDIYGISTDGSFYRTLSANDLSNPLLLIASTADSSLSLPSLLEFLLNQGRINFITSACVKFVYVHSRKIFYLWTHYSDEVVRFLQECNNNCFRVGQSSVNIQASNAFAFSSISTNGSLATIANPVINIHFKFKPNNNASPSRNILRIVSALSSSVLLTTSIAGIQLNLSPESPTLLHFGSFIIANSIDASQIVDALRSLNFEANLATFCSFILPRPLVDSIRNQQEGIPRLNNSFFGANILHNSDTIDTPPETTPRIPPLIPEANTNHARITSRTVFRSGPNRQYTRRTQSVLFNFASVPHTNLNQRSHPGAHRRSINNRSKFIFSPCN